MTGTYGPMAPGSVSLGLTLPAGPVEAAVTRLRATAALAVGCGFDGVTLSEHHGGFPGYLPDPVLTAAALLAGMPRGWAIACPAILPLRPVAAVVESLAWMRALFPGRVAAGFVPGYQEHDFAGSDVRFADRRRVHWARLAEVVAATRGAAPAPLADDPAVAACAAAPPPVVSGVAGPAGARRAASAGAGLLLMSLPPAAQLAPTVSEYRVAGGCGPILLIRRVWVGVLPGDDGGLGERIAGWRGSGTTDGWLSGAAPSVTCGEPRAVAESLLADLATSGASALNLRVELDGATPTQIDTQVRTLGRTVLPLLHAALA